MPTPCNLSSFRWRGAGPDFRPAAVPLCYRPTSFALAWLDWQISFVFASTSRIT